MRREITTCNRYPLQIKRHWIPLPSLKLAPTLHQSCPWLLHTWRPPPHSRALAHEILIFSGRPSQIVWCTFLISPTCCWMPTYFFPPRCSYMLSAQFQYSLQLVKDIRNRNAVSATGTSWPTLLGHSEERHKNTSSSSNTLWTTQILHTRSYT